MSSSMVWMSAKVAQAVAAVSPAKTIHMPDAAYDAFNSDAEDGGPEDFNLDKGMDNADLEDLDSNAKQHR
ncbi:hypothetical protein BKA82DRAFT_4362141 [Pisolithus tinctorius]|nr:hypothetical protein BKA82DRAFT_4362141 [Pisolithus tinctorius]